MTKPLVNTAIGLIWKLSRTCDFPPGEIHRSISLLVLFSDLARRVVIFYFHFKFLCSEVSQGHNRLTKAYLAIFLFCFQSNNFLTAQVLSYVPFTRDEV